MPENNQELARDLGFLEAYTIGVGTMIGAGIFVLPGIVAGMAGPASMVSFAIAGVVSLLTALSLSELATGMPRAGGSYYYVNRAMGSFFGSIVGWAMWSGLMFATAFYMLGFGQYLTYFYGDMPIAGTALIMASLLVGLNYRGTKETGAVQNVIVIVLLGFIIVFVAFGVFNIDWQVFQPFNPHGWGAVASTAATVYVTYIGFEVIATSAEEIKNPGRNLPLSMIAAVLTPMMFYVLVMLVSTGVLPVEELTESFVPVADAAGQYLGPIGAFMMVVGAVLATISSANASILSAARVNFAMGRDNILTQWLNAVHPKYRTPGRAILVTGVVILFLIGLGVGIDTLADVASFSFLVTYGLVHVAVIVMRRADPEDYEPDFKLSSWAYPTVPLLGAAACFGIVLQMRPIVLMVGGIVLLVGILWYYFYARKQDLKTSMLGDAIAGDRVKTSEQTDGRYKVVVPVANPATESMLTRLAIASAHQHDNPEIVAINVITIPRQTALAQSIAFEEERIEKQRELLKGARKLAEDLEVGLRTRAIVGRDISQVILDVLKEEKADHLLLGWSGKKKAYEHILGSNIDRVVTEAECEVTLTKVGPDEPKNVVALAGHGPFAPTALKRALQFARASKQKPTLLRIEQSQREDDQDPQSVGEEVIQKVADRANVESSAFKPRVEVADDIHDALLYYIRDYDTICVGATRSSGFQQALFGSLPEKIGREAEGTVAIVRGGQHKPRSVTQGLIDRLSSE